MSSSITSFAQGDDKHLPLSTKSDAAKTAFYEAIDRLNNADQVNYEIKIQEAIESDPQFFMAHAIHGMVNISDTSAANPKEFIDKALALPQDQLTPAEKTIRQMLVKLEEDKIEELRPLLEELVMANSNAPLAYDIAIDVSRFFLDDQEQAMEYVQKLIEVAPEHASAYNIKGYFHLDMNEMDKAKEAFDKYLSLAPFEANAHDSMGDYYMAAGDFDKSAEHFNKAFAMGMPASKEKADKATAMADDEEENPDTDFERDTLNNVDPE